LTNQTPFHIIKSTREKKKENTSGDPKERQVQSQNIGSKIYRKVRYIPPET
jgi:hypothetical protein